MNKVFLLLGSNLGNEALNLQKAKAKISELAGPIVNASSIYKTAPWAGPDQNDYLNQVIEISTTLKASVLLDTIMLIEEDLGRKRTLKNEPRLIDIDILFYNDHIIKQQNLTVPHPHLHLRRFTMVPLAEIAADFIHPEQHVTVEELLNICPDKLKVEITNEAK